MTPLEALLDEFKQAMLQKFWARHEKQMARGGSVCDPAFDWRGLDSASIDAHLRDEMREWLEPDADRLDESVDLANMAFLAWVVRRPVAIEAEVKRDA